MCTYVKYWDGIVFFFSYFLEIALKMIYENFELEKYCGIRENMLALEIVNGDVIS